MSRVPIQRLRNVALVGHGGSGKTSVGEAFLYLSGAIDRLGRTESGNAALDFEPEEVRRRISISSAVATLTWEGHRLHVIDTPGFFDFTGEVKSALRVADAAVVVVDAVGGVEVGTERVWAFSDQADGADGKMPRLIAVNRLDRENANFDDVLAQLHEAFGPSVQPLTLPIGREQQFSGVVDVVARRSYAVKPGAMRERAEGPVPADMEAAVEAAREKLVEVAAEAEDELTMKYLEGEALTDEEFARGLRAAVLQGKVVPVLAVSATSGAGVAELLNAILRLLPSPLDVAPEIARREDGETRRCLPEDGPPLMALVWKTTADPFVGKLSYLRVFSGVLRPDSTVWNASRRHPERIGALGRLHGKHQEPVPEAGPGDIVAVAKLSDTSTGDTLGVESSPFVLAPIEYPAPVYQMAVSGKAKGDEEKITAGLHRLLEEDPTLKLERNQETNQQILSGLGDMHLDIVAERLKRKFGVEMVLETPRVPYRETIRGSAKKQGRHKKQTGGRGQFGDVWLEIEPTDQEYEFVDKIFGGAVPLQYRPAVDKGCREMIAQGILAGYPITGLKVTLVDGSYHAVDSSEMAFKIAAHLALKAAFLEAKPTLLEPIMRVSVFVPDQYMGDVIGDLNKRRGRILGMEPRGRQQVVQAFVPLAEMFRYAIDLRSITQGRAGYEMEFERYEEVPSHIQQQLVAAAHKSTVASND